MTIKIFSHFDKKEDEILRKVSTEIKGDEFNKDETKKIINNMFQFITEQPDGAGLSAPQIGVNKRIFVINPKMFDYGENGEVIPKHKTKDECTYINPKILSYSQEESEMEEGCFSVRWEYGMVTRPKEIIMEYNNINGVKKEVKLEGFLSAVAQHEIDHLNGILFIDKAKDIYKLNDEEIAKIKNSKV